MSKTDSKPKSLVVFFSHEGNTSFIARKIAELTGSDILELKPRKQLASKASASRFFWGGAKVYMRTKPELKKFKLDPNDYDVLFIGTPVWAWTFAPPLRTFFADHDLSGKKVALFISHGGGPKKAMERFRKAVSKAEVLGEFDYFDPVKRGKRKDCEKKLKKWLRDLSY